MKSKLRIVSRSSNLALKQVEIIEKKLKKVYDIEIIKVKTFADKNIRKPLYEIGGKVHFVKELENVLLEKKADIAIHSLKDMETILAENTFICAVSTRESRNDVLISDYDCLSSLPKKSVIGTSSPRRTAFLKAFRKDFIIKICRGNVETRIKQLKTGIFDALVLAEAGLKRLNIKYKNIIPLKIIPPAAGQGVIAIQTSNNYSKQKVKRIAKIINDEVSFCEITAERSLVRYLNGSCQSPISSNAICSPKTKRLTLKGSVANLSGSKIINDEISGKSDDAEAIGKILAQRLIIKGAKKILGKN